MTEEERNKKLAEARARYGRPFVHEKPICKQKTKKAILKKSQFEHVKRPFNV